MVQTMNLKFNKGYLRNFVLFAMARTVSDLGTEVFKFALSLYIYHLTGSASAFSFVLVASILPGVFINVLAGVFVDKYDKKSIIVLCDGFSGILLLLLLFVFQINNTSISTFIIFSIILSTIQAFYLLALNASIPQLVNVNYVSKMNSMFQGIGAVVKIVGPVLGATLYSSIGMKYVILVDGISFFIAGFVQLFLVFSISSTEKQLKTYKESIKEAFGYFRTQADSRSILIYILIVNFVFSPLINVVFRDITIIEIKLFDFQLSIILAVWSFGIIFGSLVVILTDKVNRLFSKMFMFIRCEAITIILWCFPLIPFLAGIPKSVVTLLYCLLLFPCGVFNGLVNVPATTYLQISTPEEIRGSIFGIINTATQTAIPLGMIIYGVLADNFKWQYITTISGVFLLLVCSYANRDVRIRNFFVNQEINN